MPASAPNFVAKGNIPVSAFVKSDGSTVNGVVIAGAGDRILGISHEGAESAPIPGAGVYAATSGYPVHVYGIGESDVLLTLGNTVTVGERIKSDGSGLGIPTAGAGEEFGAIALESGVAGDKIRVMVQIGTE